MTCLMNNVEYVMANRLLIAVFLILMALSAFAIRPQRGYRGFAEWDNNVAICHNFGNVPVFGTEVCWFTGISTSHGFQLNEQMFFGIGLSAEVETSDYELWTVPAFAEVRYDMTIGKATPFADIRVGYIMTNGGGLYFSPSIGYRFNWGRKTNLNVGLGLTLCGEKENVFIYEASQSVAEIKYNGERSHVKPLFTIRGGLDF